MENKKQSAPHFTTNKWFRLSFSLLLALLLVFVALLIPVMQDSSVPITHSPAPERQMVDLSLPFGVNIVHAAAGLEIKKVATPVGFVDHGGFITYTILVTNVSAGAIVGIEVEDDVPLHASCAITDGGEIFAATDSSGGFWAGNVPDCNNAGTAKWFNFDSGNPFDNGETVSLQYRVAIAQPLRDRIDTIVNGATYQAKPGGLPPSIGQVTVTHIINAPNWEITKSVVPTPIVEPGEQLDYTVTARNNGHLVTSGTYTITDQIPANTTFVSASPPGTESGGVVTWVFTNSTLAINASQVMTYRVDVDLGLAEGTQIVNQNYSVTGGNVVSPGIGAPVAVTIQTPVTVTVTKADNPDPVPAGSILNYTLAVTNDGTSKGPASNVVITDTIPANTSLIGAGFTTGGVGTVSTSPLTVTWRITNPLAIGASRTMTMAVQVDSPLISGTILTNRYGVTGSNSTFNRIVSPATVTTTVVSSPSFTINKVDNPHNVQAGAPLTYTITYINNGNSDATSTIITDTLDNSVSFSATSGSPAGVHDGSPAGGVITWTIGTVPGLGGGSGTLTVTVVVTSPLPNDTIITNTVRITSAERVASSDVVTSVVNSTPDLKIIKSASPTPTVQSGELLTYTLTISNEGNANAIDAILSDAIPLNTVLVNGTADFNAPGVASGNPITWSIASLVVNTQQVYTFAVRVDTPLANGTIITNSALITDDLDNASSNTVRTTVESTPTLVIAKVGLPAVVTAGELVTYTLRYTNTGNADATGVTITDTFPANTTFASATPTGAAIPGGRRWNIGGLAGNDTAGVITLTLRADSPQDNGTVLTNMVTIAADQPSTNSATAMNTISSTPILQIRKVPLFTQAKAGTDIAYRVFYTNTGNMNATGVVITDTFTGGVSAITTSPGSNISTTPTSGQAEWTIGQVVADSLSKTLVMTVTLSDNIADGEILTNTVRLGSAQGLTDSHTVTSSGVGLDADLQVNKVAPTPPDPSGFLIGTPLTYTIALTNAGPDTMTVVFTDTFTNAQFSSIAIAAPYAASPCSTPATGPISCTISGFTGTTSIIVTLDTSTSISGTVSNTAAITPTTKADETQPGDNTSIAPPVRVREPVAQLSITKDRDPSGTAPVVAGQPITYILQIRNSGPDTVSVLVTDTFTNAQYSSHQVIPSTGASCSTPVAGPFSCQITNLVGNPFAVTTIQLVLDTTNSISGTISNTATITATTNVVDDPSDNTSSPPNIPVRQPKADLQITKTPVNPNSVLIGQPITYTLVITNRGPDTVDAIITDTFTNATLSTFTIDPPYNGAPCNLVANQLICTLSAFTQSTQMTVVLDTTTSVSGTVSNGSAIGAVATNVIESNPADNSSKPADVEVKAPVADLEVVKTTAQTTVQSGQVVTFTLAARNVQGDSVDVVVNDTFDSSLASFESCVPASCNVGAGTVNWQLPSFTNSQTLTLVLRTASFSGTLVNTANITFANSIGIDKNQPNNSNNASVTVLQSFSFVYLPVVIKNFPLATPTPAPTPTPVPGSTPTPTATPGGPPPTATPTTNSDLTITGFSINPANPTASDNVVVTIVLQNQGIDSTGTGFWTDFYVNPTTLPNDPSLGANRRWDIVGSSLGIAWAVPALAPGQSITLTSDGSGGGLAPDPLQTVWAGQLPAGNYSLYAFVDSFDNNDPTGATNVEVIEPNENNNMATVGPLTVNPNSADDNEAVDDGALPVFPGLRPDLGSAKE